MCTMPKLDLPPDYAPSLGQSNSNSPTASKNMDVKFRNSSLSLSVGFLFRDYDAYEDTSRVDDLKNITLTLISLPEFEHGDFEPYDPSRHTSLHIYVSLLSSWPLCELFSNH